VYVEGRLLSATLAFCFECFYPHGLFELLNRVVSFVAFVFVHPGDPVLNKLCGYIVVPSVSNAVFDLFCTVGAEAFDGKEECRAVHFWGCDSEGYCLGGPNGLLYEYLVMDLAQTVDKEGGGKAFLGCLSFLSCVLESLFGYKCLELLFFHWRCHSIGFGLGYFAHCVENAVARVVVELCCFRVTAEGDCKKGLALHGAPVVQDFLFDARIHGAGVGVMDGLSDPFRVFV